MLGGSGGSGTPAALFIENMTKPIVAVVTGFCLGGGFEIVLCCDFVLSSDDSRFGVTGNQPRSDSRTGEVHRESPE